MKLCRVLFICTGNSARSIMSEATLNHLGVGRFEAFSAGSQPTGHVNPYALNTLATAGIPCRDLSSKSWDQFVGEVAPRLDIVITVCDSAAKKPCPLLFGDFVRAHWGLADPASVIGDTVAIRNAFEDAYRLIVRRTEAMLTLRVETMTQVDLKLALDAIGCTIVDVNATASVQ